MALYLKICITVNCFHMLEAFSYDGAWESDRTHGTEVGTIDI